MQLLTLLRKGKDKHKPTLPVLKAVKLTIDFLSKCFFVQRITPKYLPHKLQNVPNLFSFYVATSSTSELNTKLGNVVVISLHVIQN
jgi:hypothetical protein